MLLFLLIFSFDWYNLMKFSLFLSCFLRTLHTVCAVSMQIFLQIIYVLFQVVE